MFKPNLWYHKKMIKAVITDFSRVLLFPVDINYTGGLNELNNKLLDENPQYNFLDFFIVNDELLFHYSKLNKTIPVHVFTSETIQDHPSIKRLVESSTSSVISASKLGIHKSNPLAYTEILRSLSLKPEEVIYIDDKQENLDVAEQVGIKTILYSDNTTTTNELDAMTR